MDFKDFTFDEDTSDNEEEAGFDLDSIGSTDFSDESVESTGQGNRIPKKTAIMVIAFGLGAFIIVCIIASIVNGIGKNKNQSSSSSGQKVSQSQVTRVESKPSGQVQSSTGHVQSSGQVQSNSTQNSSDGWMEFNSSSEIVFQEDYKELVFTVTGVHHYVKQEGTNALSIKTTLTGSLSGMSGSYEMDIPYDKGSLISVGTEFTVKVQLGEYNGRTVIGEISYK